MLKVKEVTLFKHGVAYFTLKGEVKGGPTTVALEFKKGEMNDVLKSLLVLDMGGGYVSSIAYDADQDIGKILENVAVDLSSKGSFTSLLENFRGADTEIEISGSKVYSGKIMGIQDYEFMVDDQEISKPALVFLDKDESIIQVNFSDIKTFKLLDPKLQTDLKFYLDTIITGKKKDAKRIFIHCEGEKKRELIASYILESPVWKTSYRLVIPDDEKKDECFLSGWCLVENTTQQDWEEIQLSLMAGMPVSFVCPIYPPRYIQRPVVQPPKVAQIGPADIEDELEGLMYEEAEEMPMKMEEKAKKRKVARPRMAPGGAASGLMSMMAGGGPAPAPPPSPKASLAALKDQSRAEVSTKDMGEIFEYRIAKPVTIKRKQSALVPIVSQDIETKRILLYEESQHPKNPMACLEVKNTSGVTLEQGPVTIFFEENLAGEAMLPFLNQDEVRLLNYALEQGVVVEKELKTKSKSVHRVQFGGGYSYEYYFQTRSTEYKINNKTDRDFKLFMDHPKVSGYDLYDTKLKPKDTPNFHRFIIELGPKAAKKFTVNSRYETYSTFSIWDYNRKNLLKKVKTYIDEKWITAEKEGTLKEIADLLEELQSIRSTLSKKENDLQEIFNTQDRLRQNIQSIGTSRSEIELREKYVKKLDEQETLVESFEKDIREMKEKADETSGKITVLLAALEKEE
ncbi:MAG: hypothetical protein ACFFCS_22120 [Candidatus Hodarchaeota archaeon]